jgi:hypothetical protein
MGTEVDGIEAGAGDHLAAGGLLERIVTWAGQVVGTPSGYICLIEPDTGERVLRVGTGAYIDLVGLRMLKGEGLSGQVWATGAPLASPTTAAGTAGSARSTPTASGPSSGSRWCRAGPSAV